MARALAFTQFLIVSLGALTLHLLVKIDSRTTPTETLAVYAQFMARHALWLFAIPILYAVVGSALRDKNNEKSIRMAGIILCVILVALVGLPIAYQLS